MEGMAASDEPGRGRDAVNQGGKLPVFAVAGIGAVWGWFYSGRWGSFFVLCGIFTGECGIIEVSRGAWGPYLERQSGMRPIPLPEEQFIYSPAAWRRSVARAWLLGACVALAVGGLAAVPALESSAGRPASVWPGLAVLAAAAASCVAWLSQSATSKPRLRIAADGITWQAGDVKRHLRWDEIRAVEIREDRQGRTLALSLRTAGGWPMVIRGFDNMAAVRERVRKGLAPDVRTQVKRQGIDWHRPRVLFWWACVPLVTVTLSIAWYLAS